MAKSNVAETFNIDGKKYTVVRPDSQLNEDASMEYNRVFSKALDNGALLREKLESYMRAQNLWDDKKEEEYNKLLTELNDGEMKLKKGGIKLSDGRNVGLEMRRVRNKLQMLIAKKNSLDINTAQGQAEQARFNYLLVGCILDEEGNKVYKSVSDYLDSSTGSIDEVAFSAAEKFGNLYFGLDSDYDKGLPENQFLRHWNFVDEKLRLVNKEGKLVDEDGKLIDDYGRYIDSEGNFIDVDGNPLDEEGAYNFATQPFLDDDGNPIIENKEADTADAEVVEAIKPKKLPAKKKKEQPVEA